MNNELENQSREAAMVVIKRDDSGRPTIWCDPEIVDLVRALNDGGVKTVASCSGHGIKHGNIALADGRELIIAASFDEARRIEKYLPEITKEKEVAALSSPVQTEQPAPVVPDGCVSVPRELLERLTRATGTVFQLASDAKSVMAPEYAKTHDEARTALDAAPAQGRQVDCGDAYQGAREDLAIWKRRALEAEEKLRAHGDGQSYMSTRLMNALATLAQCKMLDPLFTVCETQHQISTNKLARYLGTVGDRLKDCAFEARMGYDATEADRIKAEAERDQLRAELNAQHSDHSRAAHDVLAERRRQVEIEGWEPDHDDEHDGGELARAAACYAYNAGGGDSSGMLFPWDCNWWKPSTPRRDLIKAGALILAEIERIDRAAQQRTDDERGV